MRNTFLILIIGASQVYSINSYSQNTRINLSLNNVTVADVLEKIENSSEFFFLYNAKLVDVKRETSISAENEKISDILSSLFEGTGVIFKVYEKQIILTPNEVTVLPETLQQQLTITGKVTDGTTGEPMPGVNVKVKGTSIGGISDADGNYSLSIPDRNATLIFSFIGYVTQEILLAGRTTYNVTLGADITGLNEVVVIGYGSQKKADLTGSVVRVSMEDVKNRGNLSISQALSGASAGLNVVTSGYAGGEASLSIRGQNSLSASAYPLIVLDGIIYNGSISDININDVESVDVLKDASSAAVFGSRSANGVVIITTKKGKTEKPVISFNTSYGFQDITNNPMSVMNADQYAIKQVDYYYQQTLYAWYKTHPTSDAGKPVRPDINNREIVAAFLPTQEEKENYLAGNEEIDWVKEVLRPVAPIQSYNISFSGKSGNRTNYFLSGSYIDEQGVLLNDQFKKYTVHSNIGSKITDWLTLDLTSSYTYRDYSGLEASLGSARVSSPLADNKIGLVLYDKFVTGQDLQPYALDNLYIDNENYANNIFLVGSATITVPWVKGLKYKLDYSQTYITSNNNTFSPKTTIPGRINSGLAQKDVSGTKSWIVNNIVTYDRAFSDHQVNATLLFSRENKYGESSSLTAEDFSNATLSFNNMGMGTIGRVGSGAWEDNTISYMARTSYSFKSRYLFSATVRQDGYSGFGKNHKYATFPSVSVGWVASDESFLRNINWLYLKLRGSYGVNGNQGIGRYKSLSTMNLGATVFGPSTYSTVTTSTLGNSSLRWEKTTSANIGLDFGFLNRRISGSVDVYQATTQDVLVWRNLPSANGYSSVMENVGVLSNKGIELELTTVNLTRGSVSWKSNFVFSLNRDKIKELYAGTTIDEGNSWFVGEPIHTIYNWEMTGVVWTEQELYSGEILNNWYPGQIKYVDTNDDKAIDSKDRKIIGYGTPSYRFSINNTLSYKNFSLQFFLNSVQGGKKYYLADAASILNSAWVQNPERKNLSSVNNYWTPDNGVTNATGIYNAQPVMGGPGYGGGMYASRSFVRLQDISLTYTFGGPLLKTLKMDEAAFYIAGKNLYTWTKWPGWDPETAPADSPIMKNITMGVRFSF